MAEVHYSEVMILIKDVVTKKSSLSLQVGGVGGHYKLEVLEAHDKLGQRAYGPPNVGGPLQVGGVGGVPRFLRAIVDRARRSTAIRCNLPVTWAPSSGLRLFSSLLSLSRGGAFFGDGDVNHAPVRFAAAGLTRAPVVGPVVFLPPPPLSPLL